MRVEINNLAYNVSYSLQGINKLVHFFLYNSVYFVLYNVKKRVIFHTI